MSADRQTSSGGIPPSFTVGSLMGLPLGTTGPEVPFGTAPATPDEAVAPPPTLATPPPGVQEEADWIVANGEILVRAGDTSFRPDGVEALSYNNPFRQEIERVWFDGKIVYAVDVGEVDVDPAKVKVAQEYQIVYSVDLDRDGKLTSKEDVQGQYNIYDSVPGMDAYSPIWQFNYVVAPRGYVPNTLRSARDCEGSGYPVIRSQVFEN